MMTQSKTIAFALAFTLLLGGAVFLSKDLGSGENLRYDSYFTLERSHNFQKYHDWFSVYSSNRPSFRKPPLQYWLTAFGSELGLSDLLSLRLPSFIFFLGLAITSGLISYLLSNRNPWTVPATLLLMGCSEQLIKLGRSGLLDTGMGFFITLAVLTFFYAKENSKSWVLCGLACGLGAMQKAPVAFIYIAIMFYVLRKKDGYYQWSSLRQNKDFNRGLSLSIMLFLFWPVLQTFRYGIYYFKSAIGKEMVGRFTPFGGEHIAESHFFNWLAWLWNDLHLIGIVAIACVVLVFCYRRLRENHRLFALSSIIVIVAVAFSFATGKLYPRYLAVLTPLLVCVTVVVLSRFISWKPGVLIISVIFFGIYFDNIEKNMKMINKAHHSYSSAKEYVHLIDEFKNKEDYVLLDISIIPSGAYGYFGTGRDDYSGSRFRGGKAPKGTGPYFRYTVNKNSLKKIKSYIQHAANKESFIGFTRQSYRPAMEEVLGSVNILKSSGEFMVWRSEIASAKGILSR